MTLIPYPNDPARLAATNPIFNDNSFVRGDEQRLNNSEIWANFTELNSVLEIVNTELISQDTRLDTIESTYFHRGLIQGGIEYNTASTFPFVKQGVYEVSGKLIYKTAIYNILSSDTFFDNLQAIDSYCGYLIMMNSEGTIKYLLYGEGIAQASQSVTNITGTTTKTLTVPTVPGSGTEQYIALISGTGSFTGAFKATRASATTFTIVLNSDLGSDFTGMTVTLYYKIRTLHGTGTLANKTDTTSIVYSPSLGENTETEAFAVFDSAKNGFYCTLSGLTDYRVIGTMAGSTSSTTLLPPQILSFLSGRNKNDNILKANTISALVTAAMRWTNIETAYGCDYIFYSNNATFGSAIVLEREGLASTSLQATAAAAVPTVVFIKSDLTNATYSPAASAVLPYIYNSIPSGISAVGVTMASEKLARFAAIKPYGTSTATGAAGARFCFNLDILD